MGMDPVTLGAVATASGGLMGGAGSIMGANASAKAAEEQAKLGLQGMREQIAEQGREFDITSGFEKENEAARIAAYQNSLKAGGADLAKYGGEADTAFNTENPELSTMESDIASGNAKQLQQGASQMAANLATQGVRGGQAATLLNRGTGEQAIAAQKDVNQMKYSDAATRAAELRAYKAALAQRGQAASLQGSAF